MARNKFDVDERLESPFDIRHLKRAWKYIRVRGKKMLLAMLLSVLASLASLYTPKITQRVLDEVVPNADYALLARMGIAFAALIVVSIFCTLARSRIMAHVSQEIIYENTCKRKRLYSGKRQVFLYRRGWH